MERSAGKHLTCAGFDAQGCVAFLRRRHPVKTAQGVAADTRVPARTVERWLAFAATPAVPAFGRLVVAYGPAFLAAAVPGLAWVEQAAAIAEHEGMEAQIAELRRRQAAVRRHFGPDHVGDVT